MQKHLTRAMALAEAVAHEPRHDADVRRSTSALYYACAVIVLAWEGSQDGVDVDARRLLLADAVARTRLEARDLLALPEAAMQPRDRLMLDARALSFEKACAVLSRV